MCQAVWLKGISEGKGGQEEGELLVSCVKSCLREGLVFPFFRQLEEKSRVSLGLEQLEVVFHTAQPGSRVLLHSILETKEKHTDAYLLEPVQEVLPGIYIKKLTLFYGERFIYYITEEGDGEPNLLDQKEIIGRGPQKAGNSRKNLLGRIVEADRGEERDEKGLMDLLDEYISLDYMTEHYFKKK